MKKFFKSLVAVMLVCLMAVSFVSCGVASNPDKAKEKLDKAEYAVVYTTDDTDAGRIALAVVADGLVASIVATNGDNSISIWYFEDAKSAKAYWEKHYKGKEIKDGWKAARSGKVVYYGTDAAVKVA